MHYMLTPWFLASAGCPWRAFPDAVHLEAGDCFLLPRGRPFRLASDPTLTPVDALTIFSTARNGGIASNIGGGDCFTVDGHVALTGSFRPLCIFGKNRTGRRCAGLLLEAINMAYARAGDRRRGRTVLEAA
jgi:hypothetical protein